MSSQPVSFAGNIVLSQLWPPIYVNILHFTCLSVVAWWVPMQGATWEMQMLKIGLFLSLTPSRPLGPSLLFLWGRVHVFALVRSGMGFLLPFSVALLPSMPLSPPGMGTGQWVVHRTVMDQATDNIFPKSLLTLWGKVQPHPDRIYGFFINACGMLVFMHISSVFLLT